MNLLYDALPDTVTVDGSGFMICRRTMLFPNGKSCC